MKKFSIYIQVLFLVLMIIFFQPTTAQQSKIDSLLVELKNTNNDSIKANLYILVSNEYWSDNPGECEKYAAKSLEIAKSISSHLLMSKAYQNLASANSFIGKMDNSLFYDRLSLKEALLAGNEKLLIDICVNLSDDYIYFSKFDSAYSIIDLGIQISKKNGSFDKLCDLYINKGNAMYFQFGGDSAEIYYGEGLKIATNINDLNRCALLYNNIASIRLFRGISDSTVIKYLIDAISIHERNKDYLKLGDCYSNLASAYNIQKNKIKTIYYLKKGIESFLNAKNEIKTIVLIASIADKYREYNQMDSASYYSDIAIDIGERNNFKRGLASAYAIKGMILADSLKYNQAEKFLQYAFDEFSENKDFEGILFSGIYLASTLAKQKKYNQSISFALQVFQLSDTLNNYEWAKNSSKLLSDIYHDLNDDSKAYKYLKFYLKSAKKNMWDNILAILNFQP